MNLFSKSNFGQRKPLAAVLGLALEGNRLDGVVVRRQNGTLQRTQSFTATLSLDPLTNDPELVGREIRNHLEAAGIRERHCVVALPLKWALTAHTTLPPLTEADVAGFLQLEAERGFPCDLATLRVATSRYTVSAGQPHATFVGMPVSHVERLKQVLRAAKLKPLSFTTGVTALQLPSAEASHGVLALVLGEDQVSLQITCGGGVAALRALDSVQERDAGRRSIPAELIARETRITLGQLTPECRAAVKRIRIFGPPGLARQLAHDLAPHFETMALQIETVTQYAADEFGAPVPPETAVSTAFSLAARQLTGRADAFEFLPPHLSPWKRLFLHCASGKLQAAGAAGAALAVLVAGAFGVQQWQLFRLNSQWTKIEATASELETVQQQIRQYRPWFDDSFTGLTILRELTLAFPEDGSVTAKTLEIRDLNTVTCSGTARDHAALLRTLTQLRAVAGVHDLKVDQIRGKAPLQFTFGFQYGTETAHEN
jgi:Tfp pilus assembly protein PilN